MALTVGELKRELGLYPDDFVVEFQPLTSGKPGESIYPDFWRLKDRGGICHFEWNNT